MNGWFITLTNKKDIISKEERNKKNSILIVLNRQCKKITHIYFCWLPISFQKLKKKERKK